MKWIVTVALLMATSTVAAAEQKSCAWVLWVKSYRDTGKTAENLLDLMSQTGQWQISAAEESAELCQKTLSISMRNEVAAIRKIGKGDVVIDPASSQNNGSFIWYKNGKPEGNTFGDMWRKGPATEYYYMCLPDTIDPRDSEK